MPSKFTYSRWDGSQRGFDLDAEGLLGELADDLLYHGDVNSALRKLMQDGMRDINGDRIAGMREMMERLREKRECETLLEPCCEAPATQAPRRSRGGASPRSVVRGGIGEF